MNTDWLMGKSNYTQPDTVGSSGKDTMGLATDFRTRNIALFEGIPVASEPDGFVWIIAKEADLNQRLAALGYLPQGQETIALDKETYESGARACEMLADIRGKQGKTEVAVQLRQMAAIIRTFRGQERA